MIDVSDAGNGNDVFLMVNFQGAVPVSVTRMVSFCKEQIRPPPLTVAVGFGFTFIAALPVPVLLQEKLSTTL